MLFYQINFILEKSEAACLPDAQPTHGRACWVSGWGFTSKPADDNQWGSADNAEFRQELGLNIFSDAYCEAGIQINLNRII